MSRFVKEGPEGGALEGAVQEPEAAAPLDCRVAAGLQAKLLDGGTLVQGLQSRSRSSRPITTADRLLPSSPSSPERPGAGLQHRGDVAVEAVHRAALLPLLQAVPLLITAASPPCPEREVRNPFTLMWTRPSSRGWTEPYGLAVYV
jgi:hypothetical protein